MFSFVVTLAGQDQYYNALLSDDMITVDGATTAGPMSSSSVDGKSHISWGSQDHDFVKLNKIIDSEDGNIEFTIQPIDDCDVGLVSTGNILYGFKFTNTSFSIVANGPVPTITDVNYSYSQDNTFKVAKCGANINFFKDGIQLYSFCTTGEIGELFQLTEVHTSNFSSLIFLNFFQTATCGTSNVYSGVNGDLSRKSGDAEEVDIVNILEYKVKSNSYVFIQVIDEDGKYIRQFKKRSNSKGEIMGCTEIEKFVKGSNYRLNLVVSE